jgi:hypothetical protein
VTCQPAWRNPTAAARPPIPAPITTARARVILAPRPVRYFYYNL